LKIGLFKVRSLACRFLKMIEMKKGGSAAATVIDRRYNCNSFARLSA
jgi:hypothetical protein